MLKIHDWIAPLNIAKLAAPGHDICLMVFETEAERQLRV
jgi:hypothetical protein